MDSEILEFINEAQEALSTIEGLVINLESDPESEDIINAIFRPFHSLKGTAGFYGFDNIREIAHKSENLLSAIRKQQVTVCPEVTDAMLKAGDFLNEALDRLKEDDTQTALTNVETEFLEALELIMVQFGTGVSSGAEASEIPSLFDNLRDSLVEQATASSVAFKSEQVQNLLLQMKEVLASFEEPGTEDTGPEESFVYNGNDFSATVHQIQSTTVQLKAGPLSKDSLKRLTDSVNELKSLFAEKPEIIEALQAITPLYNFMDDDLLCTDESFQAEVGDKISTLVSALGGVEGVVVEKLGEILVKQGAVGQTDVDQALASQKKLGDILIDEGKVTRNQVEKAVTTQRNQAVKKRKSTASTEKVIRVNQDKIDEVVQQVADIVVFVESFNYWYGEITPLINNRVLLERIYESIVGLDELSRTLQDRVLSIRQVPMRQLFQKIPRMVRELSKSLDIEVELLLFGETIAVDKNILTYLEDPMVHMIRNALDHGMEKDVNQRIDAGKPAKGKLLVGADVVEESLVVTIKDDGCGINRDVVLKKAIERDLVTESNGARLSDSEVFNFIFEAGFSTAAVVTDVSGRGVGMDVVRSNIEELKGKVHIDSTLGKGSTFTVTTPLSQVLISQDALFFESSGENYAVPFEFVNTVLTVPFETLTSFTKRTLCINHAGRPMELVPFAHLVSDYSPDEDVLEMLKAKGQEEVIAIVYEEHGHFYGLIVDKLMPPQKIVLKPLEGVPAEGRELFAGISILGNGEMVLAVSMKKVVARIKSGSTNHATASTKMPPTKGEQHLQA
jgi:two-component system chemotaxis sensor kinase CheA